MVLSMVRIKMKGFCLKCNIIVVTVKLYFCTPIPTNPLSYVDNDISLFVAGPQLKNALSVLELSKKKDISIDHP